MARARRAARATPGSSVLAGVRRRLAAGWPAGLTVLTGDDLYHLDAAQRELIEHLVPADAAGFALTVFGDERVELGTVVAAARSAGMFAAARVVLVRDVTLLEGGPEPLVDYAARPPAASYLIVRAPALDRRRKLHLALASSGLTLEFGALVEPGRIAAEVGGIATARGLRLARDAAVFLAEICGGDLHRAAAELDKTRDWLGPDGGPSVTLDVLREVAAGSGLLSGWEVADAIVKRDGPAALAASRRLLESGAEPLRIVGGLAYRVRGMLDRAGSHGPYSRDELLGFPALLLAADRDLKSRSLAPLAVLETLVERMTAKRAEAR